VDITGTITPTMLFIALLGGILPAVFWLWFWLKEDRLNPEPRGLIILSFLTGMLATACAYPIERQIADWADVVSNLYFPINDFTLLFLWASTEEILKFLGIYIVALKSKYFDEPIDAVVYLVTIALGFSALENTLFLFNPLGDGDALATILLGNYRFIGATLLHVASSAIIGMCLAITFYERPTKRRLAIALGLVGAIALHTIFNFSIIASKGTYLYEIFVGLWVFILGIFYVCERIKQIPPRSHVEYPNTGIVLPIPRKQP
jgi:protease PrsW